MNKESKKTEIFIPTHRYTFIILCACMLCCVPSLTKGQVVVYEDFVQKPKLIYSRERFMSFYLHSAGFTLGYEQGKLNRKFNYSGWAVEFSTQLNPKAMRINWMGSGRNYVYGQINSFCMIRGGYGGRYVFNDKPYWGGVSLSMIYQGGLSLGLAFPQYLNIIYPNKDNSGYEKKLEKFDPNNPYHYQVDKILGRGPLMHGVWHLRPYPGAYAKFGINAEFGKKETISHALEVGIIYDCYFTPIPIMANNKEPFGFFNFYLAYRFGMRYDAK